MERNIKIQYNKYSIDTQYSKVYKYITEKYPNTIQYSKVRKYNTAKYTNTTQQSLQSQYNTHSLTKDIPPLYTAVVGRFLKRTTDLFRGVRGNNTELGRLNSKNKMYSNCVFFWQVRRVEITPPPLGTAEVGRYTPAAGGGRNWKL